MNRYDVDRRKFLMTMAGSVAAASHASSAFAAPTADEPQSATRGDAGQAGVKQWEKPKLEFAVIGINHGHINAQINAVLKAGGGLKWLYAKEPDLAAAFLKQYPQAKLARSEQEVLDDPSVKLVVAAAIPDERGPLGVRVMTHGKDYMTDKPGMTTLDQLAEARNGPGRDQADLLDHVQRAVREQGHGEGRRTGEGRRHRPRAARPSASVRTV